MAKIFFTLSIILNVFIVYASTSAFSDLLENSSRCEEKCTKSFAPHTYPNGSDNEACMRGCRLYTITSIVTADEPEHTNTIDDNGLTPAKAQCHQSCVEAYNETSSSTSACKVGCDTQELISIENKTVGSDLGEEGIHLLKPVMQIKEVVSKVVGMLRIFQSSITTYFIREDNKLVAVEGPVEVVLQIIPNGEEEEEQLEGKVEAKKNSLTDSLVSSGTASIECLSRKVGVPPYLLIISLFSFIIFLTYILFVICSTNSKKNKKMSSGLPIPSHALPVKLVRPEDLTKLSLMDEEEGHAPGLAPKVKLPNNTLI